MDEWGRIRDEDFRQKVVDLVINVFVGLAWIVMVAVVVYAGSR